jgi:peptidoglycan/LPS O-acetylase OafA/YrhL
LQLQYRPDIDGMRAIAVLAVVLFHAFPKVLPGGFVGVDAFFVISGYLITSIIVKDLDRSRFSFTQFYARRVRRLFPALFVVLLSTLLAGVFILLPSQLSSLAKNTIASSFFGANFMLLSEAGYFDIDAQVKPLLHLWSLGIEEQFYLVWPLALWFTPKRWRTATIIAVMVASFVLNVSMVQSHPDATFYLPFTRGWELMAGAALVGISIKSDFLRGIAFPTIACIGTGLALAFYNAHTTYPGWAALAPIAVTSAALLSEGSVFNRLILSNPFAVFVGKISYPLYLWHWPLLVYARLYPFRPLTAFETIDIVFAAFLLAWLTYEIIEKPFRVYRIAGVRSAIAGIAVSAIIGVFLIANPPRFPELIRQFVETPAEEPEWRMHECLLIRYDQGHEFSSACIDRERPLVALWGDSVAASLMPGLRDLQSNHHFGIAQLTSSGCQPLLVKSVETDDDCLERNRSALRRLAEARPEIVLLNALWRTSADEMKPTIDALRAIGVGRIVILGKVPVWRGGLPNLIAVYYRRTGELLPEVSPLLVESAPDEDRMRVAAAQLGVEFVSIRDQLCENGACKTRLGSSDLVVCDWFHFTAAGAKYLVRKIAAEIFGSG